MATYDGTVKLDDLMAASGTAITLDVTVHVGGGGQTFRGTSVDISSSGIFVQTTREVPQGRRVDIVIACESEPLNLVVATSATVVHSLQGKGLGLRFGAQNDRVKEDIGRILSVMRGDYDEEGDTVVTLPPS